MGPYRLDQLEPELQKIATDDYTFQNWSKTFKCKPELLFTPTTEAQVQKVKRETQKNIHCILIIFIRLSYWQRN